jgi:integrase
MPKKRLTEEAVKRIQPPASGKQVDYYDAGMPGLVLRVNYGGAKVWRALYYLKRIDDEGKHLTIPTTYKLGRYPVLNLQQARQKAREFLADPEKAKSKADTGTFKDVAQNFIKRQVDASKDRAELRSKGEIVRCLEKYVYPHWGNRSFREIKRLDVSNLLDHIEDKHGTRQADVVLAIIGRIMNWFATRDNEYSSCIVRGMKRHNGNGGRARILGMKDKKVDDNEIRAFWNACESMGQFGAYCRTLLLTAQRRRKVATMRWDDLVNGAWHIRSEAREKDHAGVLKLPKAVIEIIESQPRIAGNPYVFAGNPRGRRTSGSKAFNGFSEGKVQLDAKLPDMAHWTLHDLRRTARSLMSRAGVSSEHAERVLGHSIRGVEKVYDRHSYTDEKADALAKLAALVESIVNPPAGNVVKLAGRRSRKEQAACAQ